MSSASTCGLNPRAIGGSRATRHSPPSVIPKGRARAFLARAWPEEPAAPHSRVAKVLDNIRPAMRAMAALLRPPQFSHFVFHCFLRVRVFWLLLNCVVTPRWSRVLDCGHNAVLQELMRVVKSSWAFLIGAFEFLIPESTIESARRKVKRDDDSSQTQPGNRSPARGRSPCSRSATG
jgi:hypothetical protein